MRLLLISLSILSAGSLRVCGKDDAGGAATSASAEAAATASVTAAAAVKASVTPRIGGNVVAVGDFFVEVALQRSGLILALVFDQSGKLVNDGVKLSVKAKAKGGASSKVELAFDPPRACFHGQADAGVELESGPIEVSLEVAGKAVGTGNLALAIALPEPRFGGAVVAAGDFAVELVAKGPEIQAFVFDASGKAHAAGDLDLNVALGADAKTKVKLAWDPPRSSYKAKVSGDLDLMLEPIRLDLKVAGKAFAGAVASIKSAAALNLKADVKAKLDADVDAKLDAAADVNAKVKAPDLKAKAAAAVKVEPPKVNVSASKSASASADAKAGAGAKAGAKAGGGAKIGGGFSIGTK